LVGDPCASGFVLSLESRIVSRKFAGACAVLGVADDLDGVERRVFCAQLESWDQYQGRDYTVAICVVNVVFIVSLWGVFYRAYRLRSFNSNLLFHALLFAWLAWCAFPYW